eukprot:2299518-Lingulodinium_polyedra.AAC.1
MTTWKEGLFTDSRHWGIHEGSNGRAQTRTLRANQKTSRDLESQEASAQAGCFLDLPLFTPFR